MPDTLGQPEDDQWPSRWSPSDSAEHASQLLADELVTIQDAIRAGYQPTPKFLSKMNAFVLMLKRLELVA